MASETVSSGPGKAYIEDVVGTKYPYINLTEAFIGSRLNNLRRSIASVNPFAFPQIPSQDRMAFGVRNGNGWYNPLPYPNGIVWSRMFPAHYDPLHDEPRKERWQLENFAPGAHSHLVFTADKLPRGCVRTIQSYRRCEMINGAEKCRDESQEVLSVCPTWALDSLREKQRFVAKVRAINSSQYHEVLKVSPYNEGRTVKDISTLTAVDGFRDRLRPDTLWADERYSKITQTEINEAKKRVEERRKQREHGHEHKAEGHEHAHEHHYDYKHVEIKHPKPLYP